MQSNHLILCCLLLLLSVFQHQSLFQWVCSSHQVAKVLELQLQHVLPVNIQGWLPLELTDIILMFFSFIIIIYVRWYTRHWEYKDEEALFQPRCSCSSGGHNEQCIIIQGHRCCARSKGGADSVPENGLGQGWYLEMNHFKMDFEGWRPRQKRKMSFKRDCISNGILRKH